MFCESMIHILEYDNFGQLFIQKVKSAFEIIPKKIVLKLDLQHVKEWLNFLPQFIEGTTLHLY